MRATTCFAIGCLHPWGSTSTWNIQILRAINMITTPFLLPIVENFLLRFRDLWGLKRWNNSALPAETMRSLKRCRDPSDGAGREAFPKRVVPQTIGFSVQNEQFWMIFVRFPLCFWETTNQFANLWLVGYWVLTHWVHVCHEADVGAREHCFWHEILAYQELYYGILYIVI